MNGVSISGGLAALAGPNRLYVADAFNTRSIYEIDPLFGRLTNIITPVSNRPTALAGIGTDRLLVGDWQSSQVEVIDRNGVALGELALTDPPGSFAGHATFGPFGDADGDGDADMQDIANLQRCFGQSLPGGCDIFDFDGSTTIDLSDFALFHGLLTGP